MNHAKKLLLATVLGSMTSLALAQSLEVNITPLDQSFSPDSDVKVKVTITNTSPDAVKVLKWYLVQNEKLQNNAFDVTVDGNEVDYTGPIVKRAAPTAEDYLHLAAGETVTQTLDLSSYYDMTKAGTYNVQFDVNAVDLIKETSLLKTQSKTASVQELQSAPVSFWVDGVTSKTDDLVSQLKTAASADSQFSLSYAGSCSNRKKSAIQSAVAASQSMSAEAYQHLYDHWSSGNGSERYTTWFGTYSSNRYTTVADHFYKISTALNSKPITMDCYCEGDLANAYAYVYPNQPYHVHLCGAFWSASTKGSDSQAGTLIHEMSHFTVNGGTDDVVYGQYGARNLASSNPDQAVNNADSHEYFAENPYNQ